MDRLLHFIRSLTAFSDESWQLLQSALESRTYRKGELLLLEGEVCTTLFYIVQGYCRSYYEIDAIVKNTAFYFENEIATNLSSFSTGLPSEYHMIACEQLEVVVFHKEILFHLAKECIEIESLGRSCIRLFAQRQEELSTIFQLYTAKERLEYVEAKRPEITQRVPLTQIASFLGVTRETLSRIRRKRVM